MMRVLITWAIISAILIPELIGQATPAEKGLSAISENVIRAQMGFLASDWTEGRGAGEKGEYLASDYIASMLQLYGIKPGGDQLRGGGRSYFQNFTLLKTAPGDVHVLKLKSKEDEYYKTTEFNYNADFTFRPYSHSVEIEAPVVFAGYGFMSNKLNINDFEKLDLKGKFILKIAGTPLHAQNGLSSSELMSSAREVEKYLKEKGAAGIIEFNPSAAVVGSPEYKEFMNMSPSEGIRRPITPGTRYSIPGKTLPDEMIQIVVSVKTANEILKGTGIVLDEYIKKADANQPAELPQMTGKFIYFKTDVITSQVAVRNILGIIEGNNPEQVIMIGAHYDHMGIGNGYLWNGADDNASGTVGVMTLAKAIMATGMKPEKTIIFALWTAEEKGLLGSRYYMANIRYPLKQLRLYINFDMISRYIAEDNRNGVIMTYTASCPQFKSITETNLKKYGISLSVDYQGSDNPAGPSDESTFVTAGIPIIRIKTAHREEYHTPADEIGTIDWDIMEKIIRISFTNLWELANSSW